MRSSIFFIQTICNICTNHNNYLITNHKLRECWKIWKCVITKFWKKNSFRKHILSKKTGTYLSSKCVRGRGKNAARLKKNVNTSLSDYIHSTILLRKKSLSLQASIITSIKSIFWNIWPLFLFHYMTSKTPVLT